jgi:hypothetical protein
MSYIDSRLSEVFNADKSFERKRYILEIAFTSDEYSQLVKTATKSTKKALTAFAKDCILQDVASKQSVSEKEWTVYVSDQSP